MNPAVLAQNTVLQHNCNKKKTTTYSSANIVSNIQFIFIILNTIVVKLRFSLLTLNSTTFKHNIFTQKFVW